MSKTYLRIIDYPMQFGTTQMLEIFEGDIKKDKEEWIKHHNTNARYFELKEIKS